MKLNSMMSQELPIKVAPQTRVGQQVDENVSATRNVSSSMSIHRSLSSSSDESSASSASSASSSSSSSSVKLSSSSSLIEEDNSPIFDVSVSVNGKQQANKKPGQQITDDEEDDDDEDEDFVMSEVVRAKLSFHEDEEEESSCTLGEPPSLQPPQPPPAQQEAETTPPQQQYTTLTALKCHALYKIQEKIRSGGFGDVYKGVRKIDHAPIAIKIIRKDKINSWTLNVRDSTRLGEGLKIIDFLLTISMTKLDSTLLLGAN